MRPYGYAGGIADTLARVSSVLGVGLRAAVQCVFEEPTILAMDTSSLYAPWWSYDDNTKMRTWLRWSYPSRTFLGVRWM